MNNNNPKVSRFSLLKGGIAAFLVVLTAYCASLTLFRHNEGGRTASVTDTSAVENTGAASTDEIVTTSETTVRHDEETTKFCPVYPEKSKETVVFGKEYDVRNAILINVDDNDVVACKDERMRMYPASLTKVMTLIVAVENIKDMHDKVCITDDMVTPYVEQDASRAGFLPGETPSVEDLLYGMILNSGADAALAIAKYVAGSEENFVRLMNEKGRELGLYATHFTNVVGLHDSNHYSTAEDMAMVLSYAIDNATCRKILSTEDYKVPETKQNPEGLTFKSTLFSRMYGDEIPGVKILGGKTGFTEKAGNCIESFAVSDGKMYILVLCGSSNKWNAVYDTLTAYSVLCAEGEPYESSRSQR